MASSSSVAAAVAATTAALVAYLRWREADRCELTKRRREQAAALRAAEYGNVNYTILEPEKMAPLDEHGIPKYRGRKRGRKARKRKRKRRHDPNRPKRQHTAYTLFVQENYPSIRNQYPELQSKDIIGLIVRQWAEVSDLERQAWKQRAVASVNVEEEEEEEESDDEEGEEDEESEEEGEEQGEEEEETKKRAGRPKKK
jgi:HMG-box domain